MTTGDCREWLLEKDPEMLFWLFWAGSPRLGTSSGAVRVSNERTDSTRRNRMAGIVCQGRAPPNGQANSRAPGAHGEPMDDQSCGRQIADDRNSILVRANAMEAIFGAGESFMERLHNGSEDGSDEEAEKAIQHSSHR